MERDELLDSLRRRGLDEQLVEAVARVPRELFVPEDLRDRAWEDGALPIGAGQSCTEISFAERKPLLMMNTNRLLGPAGLFASRQPGLSGLPCVGHMFSGWSVSAGAAWT